MAHAPPNDRGPKGIIAPDRQAKRDPVVIESFRKTGNTRPGPVVKPGLAQQSAHRAKHILFTDKKQRCTKLSRLARL